MDLRSNRLWIRVSPSSAPAAMQSSSSPSVPIIAIAVIVGTALLLVSYYVFVIKCWHSLDHVFSRRFSLISRRRRDHNHLPNNNLLLLSPEPRGLDESAIRTIPILNFKTNHRGSSSRDHYGDERGFCECAVCLNEFQEDEKLRFIPQCGHVFHIDCIDIWLQNNANCPLCRTSVSGGGGGSLFHLQEPIPDQKMTTTPSSSNNNNGVIRSEEDYVVIELGEPSESRRRKLQDPPPPILTKKNMKKKTNKFQTSMGDEVIDTRTDMDDQRIQPIHRRSFSMDSAGDKQLLVAMQQIMQQQQQKSDGIVSTAPNDTRLKRTFFSFGNGLSRSAVQPLCNFQQQP